MKKLLQIVFILAVVFQIGVSVAEAQRSSTPPSKPKPSATPPKKPVATPTSTTSVSKRASLNVAGMENGDLYAYIHDGRFTRVANDMRFKMMFESYVSAFSGICPRSFSDRKVEITRYVQTYRNETTFLPWGGRLIPFTTQKVDNAGYVGTGIYAEPEFAEVYSTLTGGYMLDLMKKARGGNIASLMEAALRSMDDIITTSIQVYGDNNKLLANNGCESGATKRFAENLLRHIKGQQSAQLANGEKTFFQKECDRKLPGLIPRSSASMCACLDRELTINGEPELFNQLEDNFDGKDFGIFLLATVARPGLQQKVRACITGN
jgi:hypothetical protein